MSFGVWVIEYYLVTQVLKYNISLEINFFPLHPTCIRSWDFWKFIIIIIVHCKKNNRTERAHWQFSIFTIILHCKKIIAQNVLIDSIVVLLLYTVKK